jgi:hypothetical protein
MNTLNGIAFTAKPKALARVAPGFGTASPIAVEAEPSPTARR